MGNQNHTTFEFGYLPTSTCEDFGQVIDCLNDPTHLVAFGDSDNVPFYFTRSKVDEAAIGSMTFQDTPCVKLYAEALIALTNHYDVDPLTVLLSVEEHLIENGLVETASVDDGSVEDESIEDGSEDKEKSPRA